MGEDTTLRKKGNADNTEYFKQRDGGDCCCTRRTKEKIQLSLVGFIVTIADFGIDEPSNKVIRYNFSFPLFSVKIKKWKFKRNLNRKSQPD